MHSQAGAWERDNGSDLLVCAGLPCASHVTIKTPPFRIPSNLWILELSLLMVLCIFQQVQYL